MIQPSEQVVVDTNVVVYLFNGHEHAGFYGRELAEKRLVISFQTLEEILAWPLAENWDDRRRNTLAQHIDRYEVFWPNRQLAEISAQLRIRVGRALKQPDAWIAATAVFLGCPLATSDTDFPRVPGIDLITAPS